MSDEVTDALTDLSQSQRKERARFMAQSPQSMANVIGKLMTRRDYARVLSAKGLEVAWSEAAGPGWAAQTRVGKLQRGVLEIYVANSMLMQELAFSKKRLLSRLQEREPDQKIRDLRFRQGATA